MLSTERQRKGRELTGRRENTGEKNLQLNGRERGAGKGKGTGKEKEKGTRNMQAMVQILVRCSLLMVQCLIFAFRDAGALR